MRALILLSLLVFSLAGIAADDSVQTRSAGKYTSDTTINLDRRLSSSSTITSQALRKHRSVHGSAEGGNDLQSRLTADHPLPVDFTIFDAWLVLSGDLDDDGFYHRLNVIFDADTTADLETVYVKLYLSHEGGDWVQYATSELFDIHLDSVDDTYEVITELIDGYPPGHYDVLIELHSLYHPGVVASRIVDAFEAGFAITLEDIQHDEASRQTASDDGYVHGGGSFSLAGLLMFAMLLLVKHRYFRKRENEA